MTDFHKALAHVLKSEGGYANHKNDLGGMTYCGIAYAFWPSWKGWPIVTGLVDEGNPPKADNPILAPLVMEFYRVNFWDKIRGQQIASQAIATYLLDSAVLFGVQRAVRMAQEACNGASPNWINPDGKMGTATVGAMNVANPVDLLRLFRQIRIDYHKARVAKDPSQAVFLNGWITRANAQIT